MLPRVYPSGCDSSIGASKKTNYKKIATVFAGVFFVAVFLLLAQSALAQVASQPDLNFGLQPVEQNIGLGGEDIRLIVARIIRAVLGLLGIIAICLMLWAGYTIMTAGGNEEKIQEGKKILINAVIGLAIILSAFAIAQFVINMLAQATGYGGEQTKKITVETFAGSGALGKIVKDHYPERDQTDVARNTKIIITFAEPMKPSSFIVNKNFTCWPKDGSNKPALMMKDGGADCLLDEKGKPVEYFGDCLLDKPDFNWDTDCDNLLIEENKKGEQNFFVHPSASSTLVQAASMASYTKENDVWVAKTFVFKPLQPLGNDLEKIWYTVKLNNGVKKADGGEAFAGQHYQYYEWEFQTGTNFDFSPPYVVSAFPWPNKTEYRNTIVQLNFNEAMDPMMVQGVATQFDDASGLTSLVLNFGTTTLYGVATGEWKVSNGYKTAEFVSDQPCGLNSCGEMMYCLQLFCKDDDYDCVNKYAALVRTAEVMPGGQPFEAKPFSGVMDVAGNALDGNKDGKYQKPPEKGKTVKDVNYFKHIGDKERIVAPEKITYTPDNYGWDFKIKNDIDRTAPYLEKVEPGLDAGGVKSNTDVRMNFSKLMWVGTLANIGLQEYPEAMATSSEGKTVPVDFFFYPQSSLNEPKTITWIKHRKFGPNGFDYYYSPEIPGTVKSTNQNCLYPGYGPGFPGVVTIGGSPKCELNNYNEWGVPGKIGDCAPTTNQTTSSTDTGCVQTIFNDENGHLIQTNASTTPCLDYLKGKKISKPFPGTE